MTSTTDPDWDVSDRDTLPLCPPSPNSSLELDDSLNIVEDMNDGPSGSLSGSGSDDEEIQFLCETKADSSLRTYKTDKVVKKPGGSFRYITRRTGTFYPDGTEIIQIFKLEDGFLLAHTTEPNIISDTVDGDADGNESGSVTEESHEEEPVSDSALTNPSPNPSKLSNTKDSVNEEEGEDHKTESDLPSTMTSNDDETDIQMIYNNLIRKVETDKTEDTFLNSETPVISELIVASPEIDIGQKTESKEEVEVSDKALTNPAPNPSKLSNTRDSVNEEEGEDHKTESDLPPTMTSNDDEADIQIIDTNLIQKVETDKTEDTFLNSETPVTSELIVGSLEIDIGLKTESKEEGEVSDSALTNPSLNPSKLSNTRDSVNEEEGEDHKTESDLPSTMTSNDDETDIQMIDNSLIQNVETDKTEDTSLNSETPVTSELIVGSLEIDIGLKTESKEEGKANIRDGVEKEPVQEDSVVNFEDIMEVDDIQQMPEVVNEVMEDETLSVLKESDKVPPELKSSSKVAEKARLDVHSVQDIPCGENMKKDIILVKEAPRAKKNRVKSTDEIEIEEEMVPFARHGKTNFFWNELDEDDTLLVESRKRPHGMNSMCALCYEWFETPEDTKLHMKEVHLNGTRFHECEICGHKFLAKFLLERHAKLHKFDPKHPACCYLSEKTKLPKRGLVENHYLERERRGRISENVVQRISDKLDKIAAQSFQCIECNAEFSSDKDVLRHFEELHALKKCLFCSVACFTFPQLKRHFSKVHKYECSEAFQAGYWKFWAKANEQGNCSSSSTVDFFHNYSKSRLGPDAEYYFQQLALFEKANKLPFRSSAEEDQAEKCGTQPLESDETRVSGEEKPSKLRKESGDGDSSHLHQNDTERQCSICSRVFPEAKDLETHYRSHAGERTFSCQYCGRGFATHCNRREHERIHSGERPHVCSYCKKTFVQVSNLKKHVSMHLKKSKEPELKCTTCGKLFHKESSLILHQRAHASERKFRCQLCDKAYNYASLLKRHMRIHSGEKPYECDMCGQLFHELVSLHYHRKKIHTGERPHKCTECGRAFILSSDLKKHMGIHTKQALPASKEEDEEKAEQFQADLDLDLIGTEEPVRCTELKSKRSKPRRQNFSLGLDTLQRSKSDPMELDDLQENSASDAGSPASSLTMNTDREMSMEIAHSSFT